jgi:hypothetical protein
MFDTSLENCIFYISQLYEFSHRLGQTRPSGDVRCTTALPPKAEVHHVIHNADARLLDRNVQSSKMVHAALLLLMLEAVFTDLVSPSA